MSFSELLRDHRRAAGLTQEGLAERALLSGQAVGALERGDRKFPRQDTVARLADALSLSGEARAAFAVAAARRGRPRVSARDYVTGDAGGRAYNFGLPCDVADFTGRGREVETCERLVSIPANGAPVIVAISGMAGSGKSTLALHVAHQLADRFADAQFFVDLHGHTPGHEPVPAHVALDELLRQLGIPGTQVPAALDARSALWRSELVHRRTLIVLDNVGDAGQVRPLLPGVAGHLVLVTSRHRLADLDGVVDLALEPMPGPDAAELFERVAQRPVAERAAVSEVVELCGRLPLAIRLAATRLRQRRSWTVAGLADRLRDQQRRLGELAAGSRSVAGAFELSYRLLTAWQQRLFRLLGLHPGPDIDPYAAAALGGLAVDDARCRLEHLADAHLLHEHAADRYTFHDLLRDYASTTAHELEPEADRHAALTRLIDYYLCAAANANRVADPYRRRDPVDVDRPAAELPSFPGPRDVLTWWEVERANLVSATHAAAHAGLHVQAWQLAQSLVPFFSQTCHAEDRHDTHRTALRCARRVGDRVAEANILVDLGVACRRLGRMTEARKHTERAVAVARDVNDAHAHGRALRRLAIVHQSQGELQQAEHCMHNALALFRTINDRRHEGVTLANLAVVYEHAGRTNDSLRTFHQALSVMRRHGPHVYLGRAHGRLASLYLRLGRHSKARAQLDHALRQARDIADHEGEVWALLGLGVAHLQGSRPHDARECFQQVLDAIAAGLRLGLVEARALSGLGAVQSQLGNHADAITLHERALSTTDHYGDRDVRAAILNDLAETHTAAHRHADAADAHREALALAHQIGLPHEKARARRGLARARARLSEHDSASLTERQSDGGDRPGVPHQASLDRRVELGDRYPD